ncbi:hypothetical protein HGRIS_005618 [Hohenbuehelia grisea]|uniref:Uncharacterized protein n=1 Tax=Hohenbuehelia grisea TaxID=104357 RepID=A0ABR3JYF2_9AGAR
MSFANSSNFSIHSSTFNHVLGNQTNITHNVTHYQLVRNGVSKYIPADPRRPTFPLPSSAPYHDLICIIVELQEDLFPIDSFVSEAHLFGDLQGRLELLLRSAAFAGCIAEILEGTDFCPSWYLRSVKDRVENYHSALRLFLRTVTEYRKGLEVTLVGPLWRRIVSFIVWSLSVPDIQTILSAMNHEIEGFQKPLKQFLCVFQRHVAAEAFFRWHDPERHRAFAGVQDALKLDMHFLRDVSLDVVAVMDTDESRILIPTLWCSSWKELTDLFAIFTRRHSSSWGWTYYRGELINADTSASEFSLIPNGAIAKPVMSRFGLVFFEDNPRICLQCGCKTPLSSETSLIKCFNCELEYTVRADEPTDIPKWGRDVGIENTIPSYVHCGSHVSLEHDNAVNLPESDQNHRTQYLMSPKPRAEGVRQLCLHYNKIWSQITTADEINNIHGPAMDITNLLRYLTFIDAPLKRWSAIVLSEWDFCNIKLPNTIASMDEVKRRKGKVTMQNVKMVTVATSGSKLQEIPLLLDTLSLPNLEVFELGVFHLAWRYRPIHGESQYYDSLRSFLLRAPTLKTLCIVLRAQTHQKARVLHHKFYIRLLQDILPKLRHLEYLTVRIQYRSSWNLTSELIPMSVVEKARTLRKSFGKLKALRAEYTCLRDTNNKSNIRNWHPEPWVVSKGVSGHHCVAELHLDSSGDDSDSTSEYESCSDQESR